VKAALAGGPRKVRLEGDGPIVVLHGAGRVPFPVVGHPPVGVSARVIRLELDHPVECSDRAVEIALLIVSHASNLMDRRHQIWPQEKG